MMALAATEGRRREHLVLAIGPPARRHVVALVEGDEQGGDVPWIVLLIAVHDDHHPARGVLESGTDPCGLAEVATEFDDLDPGIPFMPFEGLRPGAVGTAVIDQDHLEGEW